MVPYRFISAILLASLNLPAQAPAKTPAFAVIDPADAAQWDAWAKGPGWRVVTAAPMPAGSAIDARTQALAEAIRNAVQNSGVDPSRVYLVGRGTSSGAVFYAASRLPDLFAGAFALGGSPRQATDTGIVFTANFTNTPLLWAGSSDFDRSLAAQWKAAGMNIEYRQANGLSMNAVVEWLSGHQREDFPPEVDCETTSTAFASCFWVKMAEFDPAERNDVLPSSALKAGSGAMLDVGAFEYKADDPGPGIQVAGLPAKYDGPLKTGDRLLELDGKPIENGRAFEQMMRDAVQTKDTVVLVEQNGARKRIETRIIVPDKPKVVTARVQAHYAAGDDEIQIVSRGVTELHVTIPAAWEPVTLYWNGLAVDHAREAGCLDLTIRKEILHAEACQP
ncbi:MAG TPA: hypothetical protein VMU19_06950 [Bryobacteraceae bacterium]|nr:hypothetical protein [Bryobacteraceae bacterium]